MAPMMKAAQDCTKAQGPVMDTRPASAPLPAGRASGTWRGVGEGCRRGRQAEQPGQRPAPPRQAWHDAGRPAAPGGRRSPDPSPAPPLRPPLPAHPR